MWSAFPWRNSCFLVIRFVTVSSTCRCGSTGWDPDTTLLAQMSIIISRWLCCYILCRNLCNVSLYCFVYPAGQKSVFSQTLALIFFRPALLSGAVRQKELVTDASAVVLMWTRRQPELIGLSSPWSRLSVQNSSRKTMQELISLICEWERAVKWVSLLPPCLLQVCFQSDCLLSLDCYLRNQITAEGYRSNWVTKRRMLDNITHQKTSGELRKFHSYFY